MNEKKRAGLSYNYIKEESKSVDAQEIENWKKILPDLITDYNPKDVYNMDEWGLFFNLLPDKTYAYKAGVEISGSPLVQDHKKHPTDQLNINFSGPPGQ